MPRALLRAAVPLSRDLDQSDDADRFALLPPHENVTEAAASAAKSPDNLIRWLANHAMVSLHELVEDSKGEVSTLKVTILAVAAVHVIALVRGQSTSPERWCPRSRRDPPPRDVFRALPLLFQKQFHSFLVFSYLLFFFFLFQFFTREGSRVRGRLELCRRFYELTSARHTHPRRVAGVLGVHDVDAEAGAGARPGRPQQGGLKRETPTLLTRQIHA